ncbi:vWA domain-containing protein [Hymenobacter rubidus]|uniref:vWA domain-containing protein n=1 Tax=Hymenobacter rubidus TaxID=1441626 RepID=UPI00191E8EFA|nr:VWA domain-containing protein [Hymenobacter rubidus]
MSQAAFHEPAWLLLFALFPVLLFLHVRYFRQRHPGWTLGSLPGSAHDDDAPQRITPPDILLVLRLLALAGIILGLANFKTGVVTRHRLAAEGIDIVMAMDVSTSMLVEDIKPNRLEGLKTVITRFVAGRTNDRLGLVIYAGESLNWCPLTTDYAYLLQQLNRINEPDLADGTAIGMGLASAVNALRLSKAKSKVIILLTDGENTTGFIEPATAALLAQKNKVKVYTIGVGTTGLAPWPFYDTDGHKTYHYVPMKIDVAALTNIAQQTGGRFFRATDATSLSHIYQEINGMAQSPTGYRTDVLYTAHYRWFLLPALLFFLIGEGLKLTLLRSLA